MESIKALATVPSAFYRGIPFTSIAPTIANLMLFIHMTVGIIWMQAIATVPSAIRLGIVI
jgi:hypothetical protein